jgi:hypothetical protein
LRKRIEKGKKGKDNQGEYFKVLHQQNNYWGPSVGKDTTILDDK